jgi:Cu/Zn superoxide dismutase
MRSIALTLGVAAVAAAAGTTAVADAHGHSDHGRDDSPTLQVSSVLRDLQPATAEPFDGATSRLRMNVHDHSTSFSLKLAGIDRAAANVEYGAHLHVGRCVAGDGAAAGPHYNVDVLGGVVPPRVDETTEVWLDFRVRRDGTARARAWVPFVVQAGDRAVVIHAEPTSPTGTAGARLACLPVVW